MLLQYLIITPKSNATLVAVLYTQVQRELILNFFHKDFNYHAGIVTSIIHTKNYVNNNTL